MSVAPSVSFFSNHLRLPQCLQQPSSVLSGNRLLDSLAKSGRLDEARHLFDQMPHRDGVTWNTLIAAYARAGRFPDALSLFHRRPDLHFSSVPWSSLISGFSRHGRAADALRLFRHMLAVGLRPDPYSLGGYLRSCSALPSLFAGELAHALSVKSSLSADPFVAASLIDMYSKCGQAATASDVFVSVPTELRSNRVLWTAVITALTSKGDYPSAMESFRLMRTDGLSPNEFTLPGVLTACAAELVLDYGWQVHALAIRTGLDGSQYVQSSLVSLYAKCSDFASAKMVLRSAECDDPVSWNSLIVNCSRSALYGDTLHLFAEMRRRDIPTDEFTFPSALNSLAAGQDSSSGEALHCLIHKAGFVTYQHVGNALVDMYAKCALPELAQKVFDDLPQRDIVGWTALYNGYAQHVSGESALRLFCRMSAAGNDPDEFIVSGVLSSCADLTLLELGRQVHAISSHLSLTSFPSVGNALVTMYAKSGCTDEARAVFNSMLRRDAITWTAMIVCYAQNGLGCDSIPLFHAMLLAGARPDYVTFIGLLFACSHAGLVDAGRAYFDSMELIHGVIPGPEHYACMVDLLGRAGHLGEAEALAASTSDATVWKALLAASRLHRNVEAAERAATALLRLSSADSTAYVMLSNVYSAAGRWPEMARVRGIMRARGVNKDPGCSWVEDAGRVHVFHVADRGHPRASEIHKKVAEMMERARAAGYSPESWWSLQDSGEEEREKGLELHSEKLAVAFGLLGLPLGKPIRVFKNLRICGDCHNAMKVVAKVYGREIVLRDANCFHHFSGGYCSCGDYW
ncbi:Putative pentatricopeptide repeat-containing protein [Apostasia shenzhenica]|uniref:Pentatricopeptide repeat-containing protein n=1 Tax=Apostasia shenzhenica TaxID=1088818 RepID=A0A2I0AM61_9ASPA|nr:Putative pentatricopeptide repeat-containing protein [Apostasia shenzhenica]